MPAQRPGWQNLQDLTLAYPGLAQVQKVLIPPVLDDDQYTDHQVAEAVNKIPRSTHLKSDGAKTRFSLSLTQGDPDRKSV